MTQNLKGLSFEVCSTNIAKIYRTRIIYPFLGYAPAVCCYATRTYEIHLYQVDKKTPLISIHDYAKDGGPEVV